MEEEPEHDARPVSHQSISRQQVGVGSKIRVRPFLQLTFLAPIRGKKLLEYYSPVTARGLVLRIFALLVLVFIFIISSQASRADQYRFVNAEKNQETISARPLGKNRGLIALEQDNGHLRVLPARDFPDPIAKTKFEPVTPKQMGLLLEKKFGKELFRYRVEEPYMVGLVLMAPVDKRGESQADGFLRKAGKFMKNVESRFLKFTKKYRLKTTRPEFPMVVLIFESDDDFFDQAVKVTKNSGLSAENIAGFYNQMSNRLNIRMTECTTFAVPLHEAIHQLVYNYQVIKRLTPVPTWFNEGIATGFESHGGRALSGPSKIHWRYADRLNRDPRVSWETLIRKDDSYHGDVLAGAAYSEGWGLHWLLVNQHKKEYTRYVKLLSEKRVLQKDTEKQRMDDFKNVFGDDLASLKKEMQNRLKAGSRYRKPGEGGESRPGVIQSYIGLADIRCTLLSTNGGPIRMQGKLKNLSSLRPLTFKVTAKYGNTVVAKWTIEKLAPLKMASLRLIAFQPPPGAVRGKVRISLHVKSMLSGTVDTVKSP